MVELRSATVGKLTVLTIGFAIGLTFAPAASAQPIEQGSNCDSNYSGVCVPIASDVDCEGGSGNGPEYVSGPVTVVGDDVYELILRSAVNASLYPSSPPTPAGTNAPAESFIPISGMPRSAAM